MADLLAAVLLPEPAEHLLQAVTALALPVLGAASCSVARLDEDRGELAYVAATGRGADAIVGVRLELGRGLAGYVAGSGQSLVVDDATQDPRFAADVAERIGYVPRRVLAVPVVDGDTVLGVLQVLDPPPEPPDRAIGQLELAGRLADVAARALLVAVSAGAIGQLLLRAAADAADDADLAAALRRRAGRRRNPDAPLAGMATVLAELARLGPAEQATATELLDNFLGYARRRRRR